MPCPELACLGLDRGDVHGGERPVVVENTRIRHALQVPIVAEKMSALVDQVIFQLEEYRRNGFSILGIIGIDRSPSCGVNTTSDRDRELVGKGVFVEKLGEELSKRGISIPMFGVKGKNTLEAAAVVREIVGQVG